MVNNSLNLKILGGIVTYNPNLLRLLENVSTLITQVDYLYIFDNNSKNLNEIKESLSKYSKKIFIYSSSKNVGIAKALIELMNFAKANNFDWVLTADQDSILDKLLVKHYLAIVSDYKKNDIGLLTCLIKDRNFSDPKAEEQSELMKDVDICITAASFMNVHNYFQTKGYNHDLFIDLVDTDICFTLRENGFRIIRINYLGLYQEIGKGENKKLFWKKIIVHHSSIFREYYMIRNIFLLHHQHSKLYGKKDLFKALLSNLLILIFFEDNKSKRLKQFIQGLKDGIYVE